MQSSATNSYRISINTILIILVIFTSTTFFDFVFVPPSLAKASQMAVIFIMLAMIALIRVYDHQSAVRKGFLLELLLLFIGVALSMVGAYVFHSQGFKTTAIVQRAVYFFDNVF